MAKNHLFFFAGSTKLSRLRQRFQLEFSKKSGRTIATEMVNTKIPSLEAGLYGHRLFAHMPNQWHFLDGAPNPVLRRRILTPIVREHSVHFFRILQEFSAASNLHAESLVDFLVDFFVEFYKSIQCVPNSCPSYWQNLDQR